MQSKQTKTSATPPKASFITIRELGRRQELAMQAKKEKKKEKKKGSRHPKGIVQGVA